MINERTLKKFCDGDYTQIENFEEAIKGLEQNYVLVHRLPLSKEELIARGLYYHCPPEELKFVKREDRQLERSSNNKTKASSKSPETLKKLSESHKGLVKGWHWHLNENGKRVWSKE